jgi:O-antigen/teichoic acid export membrane protein
MIASILIISGVPDRVVRARLVQLAILIVGLVTLGPWLGIAGVALAVDVMLVVGMAILYAEARRFTDFSLKRIFGLPALAMGLGVAAVYGMPALVDFTENDWLTGLAKVVVFSLIYAGTLALVEREQLREVWNVLLKLLRPMPLARSAKAD